MSQSVHVYLDSAKLGSRDSLQEALQSAGLGLALPEAFDPLQPQGFREWSFENRTVEFGYDLNTEPERFPMRGVPAGRRLAAELTVSARSGESGWRAASALAAAIAAVAGGCLVDQQSGERFKGSGALKWATGDIEDILEQRALALPHVDAEFEHLRKVPWWRFW